MRRRSREAVLLALGLPTGVVLFLVPGSFGHVAGIGYYVWGWPLLWRYQADMMGIGINWTFLYEDVLFWVAISVLAVELASHLALPALRRLRMHYSRRDRMVSRAENPLPGAP